MACDVNRPPTPLYGFKVYNITPRADTAIISQSKKDEHGQRKSVKFRVNSKSLQAASDYFRASFHFNNEFKHELILKDDDPDALRVCLIYLHAAAEHGKKVSEGLNISRKLQRRLFRRPCVKSTDVARLWSMVNAADKYLIDLTMLKGFFDVWFHRNVYVNGKSVNLNLVRNLVPLCYLFDHAEGFSVATKYFVHKSTGPMTETVQSGEEWEHQHLYTPELDGIVDRTRGLLMSTTHGVLTKTFRYTNYNFNGLCMDCMARESSCHEDLYTEHLKIQANGNGRYDTSCRIRHGGFTWYASRCRPDEHVRESEIGDWPWDVQHPASWWDS